MRLENGPIPRSARANDGVLLHLSDREVGKGPARRALSFPEPSAHLQKDSSDGTVLKTRNNLLFQRRERRGHLDMTQNGEGNGANGPVGSNSVQPAT